MTAPLWPAFVVVAASVALALLVRFLVARVVPRAVLEGAQGTADRTTEALAGLYGVLVAFILGGSWDRLDSVRDTIVAESTALAEVVMVARLMPAPLDSQLVATANAYQQRQLSGDAVWQPDVELENAALIRELWRQLATFEPRTSLESEVRTRGLDAVQRLTEHRRLRIGTVPRGLHAMMWIMLLGGGVATLVLIALSRPDSTLTGVYLAMLSMVIAFSLYMIYALSTPVRSGVAGDIMPLIPPLPAL